MEPHTHTKCFKTPLKMGMWIDVELEDTLARARVEQKKRTTKWIASRKLWNFCQQKWREHCKATGEWRLNEPLNWIGSRQNCYSFLLRLNATIQRMNNDYECERMESDRAAERERRSRKKRPVCSHFVHSIARAIGCVCARARCGCNLSENWFAYMQRRAWNWCTDNNFC